MAASTMSTRLIASGLDRTLASYQRHVSPLLGQRCRFYPSCSHYARSSLEKYSLPRAMAKILWRLARCQPFHPGGVDLP